MGVAGRLRDAKRDAPGIRGLNEQVGTGSVITASKLDGTRVEYVCHTRSQNPVNYWAQTRAVPSPTGSRVCFATNWGIGDRDKGDCHSFIADFRHLF